MAFGTVFGAYQWRYHASIGNFASAGTVLLAVLPLLVGVQLLLSFLGYDIGHAPNRPIHPFLAPRQDRTGQPPLARRPGPMVSGVRSTNAAP